MLTITFSWNMDSALQLFWHGRRFVFLSFFLFSQASIDTGFSLVFTSERISGRHALRNFSKDDTYDLAVFALLASLPAGLHVLGIRD
jgi:hypothetical protein